ncbi:hypothetical protein ACFQ9V_13110 [Leifsonia sp. NPDC056665]|uniref:hypothetical protein n=1 Tax=Leifsonia sp. NPDC056665 TaxID=3345901 RepID=UPI00367D4E56
MPIRPAARKTLTTVISAVFVVSLAACAGPTTLGATDPSPSASATPVSYPAPTGCPTGKDLGKSFLDKPDQYVAIDFKLLAGQVAKPLPDGGCAYIDGDVHTSNNSTNTYRQIAVWYFNVGSPGKQNAKELAAWAVSAGGTPAVTSDAGVTPQTTDQTGLNFDLPESFTDWTGGTLSQVDGVSTKWGWNPKIIPEYTQGAQAQIEFNIYSEKADAILKASKTGTGAQDPTKMLSQGLAATFTTTVSITDQQGYTAKATINGTLQPWTKDVANAAPGKMNPVSVAALNATVTNTTAQRNTTTPPMTVVAVYPASSAVCGSGRGGSIYTRNGSTSTYCGVDLGSLDKAALTPDGTQTLAMPNAALRLGSLPEAGDALTQLNTPTSIYVFFGESMYNGDWKGDHGCQTQTESWSAQWFVSMSGWPDVICQ